MQTLKAFTLIELLVVITIIVVLLALLTPALDQAVYQAQLAACGSQLHAIVFDTQQYAMDFKRHYPYRAELANMQTIEITEQGRGWDLRPIVKGYLPVNQLTCPLSGKVDIEGSKTGTGLELGTTYTFGSYDYWTDWRYYNDPGGTGMARVGDRFTCTDDATPSRRHSFNLLASDRDVIGIGAQVQGSHPDGDGTLRQVVLQDGVDPWNSATGAFTITIALWWNSSSHARGSLDRNFGYQDGAVTRLTDLIVTPSGGPDERLVTAPIYSDGQGYAGSSAGTAGTYYTALPRE